MTLMAELRITLRSHRPKVVVLSGWLGRVTEVDGQEDVFFLASFLSGCMRRVTEVDMDVFWTVFWTAADSS